MKFYAIIFVSLFIAACVQNPFRTVSSNGINNGKGKVCWSSNEELRVCELKATDKNNLCFFQSFAKCDSHAVVKDSRACAKLLFERHGNTIKGDAVVTLHDRCMQEKGWDVVYSGM